MSYVAEPYAQFVDDLLRGLTGGVVRTRFRFVEAAKPFLLDPPGPVLPSSLRVFGQADRAFRFFRLDQDFAFRDRTIVWLERDDGTPAADAVWPDRGTDFFVNYDHKGRDGGPLLTDRNPGSVTRLLSETFGRELAVLSRQLESVYEAGFLDTATGRDLDQLVALVGLERRDRTHATGTVVFSRTDPASADITVPEGTLLSTTDAPAARFETSEPATLRRGALSVEVPVRAVTAGAAGVVGAGTIGVVHRPIFGVDRVSNPAATTLGGEAETDAALRLRAKRALEGAGKATTGSLLGALATLPGVREKDVRIAEDHLARPGMIAVNLAARLSGEDCVRAVDLLARTRPAGVRVLHNLDCTAPVGPILPGENEVAVETVAPDLGGLDVGVDDLFYPVVIEATILPAGEGLTATERAALKRRGEAALEAFVAERGIGETLVYNRLVAELMELDGVQDVTVALYAAGHPDPAPVHRNLQPPGTLRASVDRAHGGAYVVQVGGQLVAVDAVVEVQLKGAGLVGDPVANLEAAREVIADQLAEAVDGLGTLSVATLKGAITESDSFSVGALTFRVEWLDAGVRDNEAFEAGDPGFEIGPLSRPWIRSVELAPTG